MSQVTDFEAANQLARDLRLEFNAIVQALASSNSGPSAPPFIYGGMLWLRTSDDTLLRRNTANTAWTDLTGGGGNDSSFTVQTLSADYDLLAGANRNHFLNPGGSPRNVTLNSSGHFRVFNTDMTYDLTILQGADTVRVLGPTTKISGVELLWYGSDWLAIELGGALP